MSSNYRFALLLSCLLYATYWIYSQGFSADFKLDDFHNLTLLGHVTNLDTLLLFVFSGYAGPTGRPLALLSFLINQSAWPIDAEPFLYTNTLIHLINGLFLTWLTFLLAYSPQKEKAATTAALISAGLWLLHPMFVSTTLYTIQRMTLLSATFLLAGLVGYVISRKIAQDRPALGAAGMFASIVIGSGMAVLCKENGAILPILAWLIDVVFLHHCKSTRRLKQLQQALTIGPTLILAIYIIYKLPGLPASYATRDFSLADRLLTEPRVLFDYLRLIVIPVRSQLGLFHDDYLISRGCFTPPTAIAAILSALMIIGMAIWQRKSYPLFFFAVTWFLIGHAMESTIFPLEIYFEHRNYIPAAGIALAASIGFTNLRPHLKRIAATLLSIYFALSGFVLFETTSQWGEPAVAAELWHQENPDSDRALQYYAQSLLAYNRLEELETLFKNAVSKSPNQPSHRLQRLITSCLRQTPMSSGEWTSMQHMLRHAKINFAVPLALDKLYGLAIEQSCPAVINLQQVESLTQSLLTNDYYLANPVVASRLHLTLAQIYDNEEDLQRTLINLKKSKKYRNYPETSLMIASVLAKNNQIDDAILELNTTLQNLNPSHPTQRHWITEINEVRKALIQLKESSPST